MLVAGASSAAVSATRAVSKTAQPRAKEHAKPGSGLPEGVTEMSPFHLRLSQKIVNKVDSTELIENMQRDGWGDYDPIDAVRMSDEHLTSVDNKRVLAAREVGIPVRVRERRFNEKLPEEFLAKGRFRHDKHKIFAETWEQQYCSGFITRVILSPGADHTATGA